jgi:hypothetical protein
MYERGDVVRKMDWFIPPGLFGVDVVKLLDWLCTLMSSDVATVDSSGGGVWWQCLHCVLCGAKTLKAGRLLAGVSDARVPVIVGASFEECVY